MQTNVERLGGVWAAGWLHWEDDDKIELLRNLVLKTNRFDHSGSEPVTNKQEQEDIKQTCGKYKPQQVVYVTKLLVAGLHVGSVLQIL